MTRFYLTIPADEWLALVQAANRNCRDPRQEARHILRSVLLGNPPDNSKSICHDSPDQPQKGHTGADVSPASSSGGVKLALEAPGNGQRRHVGA